MGARRVARGERGTVPRAAAVLVAAAAMVTGCSGSDDGQAASDEPVSSASGSATVVAQDDQAVFDYVAVTAPLSDGLRAEMVLTAQIAAGVDGAEDRLVEQRLVTDGALAAYLEATDGLENRSPEWTETLDQVEIRLEGVETIRTATDNAQTTPLETQNQYGAVLDDIADSVRTSQWEAQTADGVRVPLLMGNALRFYDNAAADLALLTLLVANDGAVSWTGPTMAVPCDPAPAPCHLRDRLAEVDEEAYRWAAAAEDMAGPEQKQRMRDAGSGAHASTSAELHEAVVLGQPIAAVVDADTWAEQVDQAIAGLQTASIGM